MPPRSIVVGWTLLCYYFRTTCIPVLSKLSTSYISIVNVRVPWLMANVKSAYIRTATKACTLRRADRTTLVFIGRPRPRDGDTRTNRRSSSIVRRPDETVYDRVYKTVINHFAVPGAFYLFFLIIIIIWHGAIKTRFFTRTRPCVVRHIPKQRR